MGLESLEARIVVHEKNEAVYEENIAFLKYDVQGKDISINELKNQLENSNKCKDKNGLGYDSHVNESEVLDSVFDNHESDRDNNQVNDGFKNGKGYHEVPPPYIGNFKPARANLSFAGLDDSVYKSKVSETITSKDSLDTTTSKTSKDSLEKPKTVRPSAPIIEEWESDSDDDCVARPSIEQNKPTENHRKSESSRVDKRNWNGLMTQKLGDGFEFKKKACFVWKGYWSITGQREIRPVWNNAQRVNHQNKLTHPHPKRNFIPAAVLTKSGQALANAAKQSSHRAAVSVSTARRVNTAAPKPKVNDALPKTYSYFKAHSLVKRPFNLKSAAKINKRVNTAKVNNVTIAGSKAVVSTAKGKGKILLRTTPSLQIIKRLMVDLLHLEEVLKDAKLLEKKCDKKKNILFTETECLVLSPDFKLLDENQVLLKIPKHNNIYIFDLKNVVPSEGMENHIDHKVKEIKCDNGTEFKNKIMNELCEMKGIRSQQNGVAERKNMTLIEVARTMLADSKLPTTFWAEAVNTACYVQNRVLVIKPHNKTPYELFLGRKPALSFMRPFGCLVTILNTLDHLGKFNGKSDDGFFVGYSINSKAFRVFNTRTIIVEENLHINFLENKPNVARTGPNWMFDIDTLTMSMNYQPVFAGNQNNGNAGSKSSDDKIVVDAKKESTKVLSKMNGGKDPTKEGKAANTNSTNRLNTISSLVNIVSSTANTNLPIDPLMPELEDTFDLKRFELFRTP
ncbi:ribonuclease H-like domain-containing protein [Tanacetum coccineum]